MSGSWFSTICRCTTSKFYSWKFYKKRIPQIHYSWVFFIQRPWVNLLLLLRPLYPIDYFHVHHFFNRDERHLLAGGNGLWLLSCMTVMYICTCVMLRRYLLLMKTGFFRSGCSFTASLKLFRTSRNFNLQTFFYIFTFLDLIFRLSSFLTLTRKSRATDERNLESGMFYDHFEISENFRTFVHFMPIFNCIFSQKTCIFHPGITYCVSI
jgi:hypothetical protein